MFMKDIYRSLTENNGEAGILKNLLDEDELNDLKTYPFHITGTDIRVRKHFEWRAYSSRAPGKTACSKPGFPDEILTPCPVRHLVRMKSG